ncbi:MAG: hypothetical protein JNM51_13805, partial [Bacteroidia bacterium]|nr:hypothetical protein [Bacteroidia bacterium]
MRNIYIVLFLTITSFTLAQSLYFEQFTTKDGLLSDEVYNLHQDKQGYLWLFTNYGAMKYNGKTFEPVLKNLSLKESFIYSFFENKKGDKWAANSNAKIFRIINDSAFVVEGTESISEKLKHKIAEIKQLYIDDSLNIYACTKMYSYKFIKSKNYFQVRLNTDPFKDSVMHLAIEVDKNRILSVFNDSEKNLRTFFSTKLRHKIKFISGMDQFLYKFSLGDEFECKPGIFKRFGDKIYFNACSKLYCIDKNILKEKMEINSTILFFTKDKKDHLWVGSYNGGLDEFDEKDSLVNHYFEKKTINCVLFDSQNGLWVSTEGSGLFHCKRVDEMHFSENHELGKSISLLKIINNKLFIGNSGGDIFIQKDSTRVKFIDRDSKFEGPHDILEKDNFYIITSRSGIRKMDKTNKLMSRIIPEKFPDFFY